MRTILVSVISVLVLVGAAAAQSKSLEGVWRLSEVATTGDNAGTKQISQPSMYLFTKKHYSIIYVSSDKPRPEAEAASMTADQLRDVFVSSFIANAGTYDYKNGKLTIHPMVAKSPSYMKDGTWSAYSVKMDGNTLTLVTDSSSSGPSTRTSTFKLTRVE
jgi:Lipocalin-like domain